MSAPLPSPSGALLLGALVSSWLLGCRPPAKVVRAVLLLGLVLFVPLFVLVPLCSSAPGQGWLAALGVPWVVTAKGVSSLLVAVAGVTVLELGELQPGLAALPIPTAVSALLGQILHQTGMLVAETNGIVAAMAVRGATGRLRTTWRVLAAIPTVWLPRIVARAERVAAAMELRGYGQDEARLRTVRMRSADAAVLAAALAALALTLVLRFGARR